MSEDPCVASEDPPDPDRTPIDEDQFHDCDDFNNDGEEGALEHDGDLFYDVPNYLQEEEEEEEHQVGDEPEQNSLNIFLNHQLSASDTEISITSEDRESENESIGEIESDSDFSVSNLLLFSLKGIIYTFFSFKDDPGDDDMEPTSYKAILKKLSSEWMNSEINHRISKSASNELFEIGKKWMHPLYEARKIQGIYKETPQFVHIRRQLIKRSVPKVDMEIAYEHKDTKEITTVKDVQSTPRSRFPPSQYTKVYEIGTVKVIFFLFSL